MKNWVLMSILGTLLLGGCAQNNDNDSDNAQLQALETQYSQEVQGTWTGPCEVNPDQNFSATMVRLHLTFIKENFSFTYFAYDSNDCSGSPIYYISQSGSFRILESRDSRTPDGPRKIDIENIYTGLTPARGTIVDQLNISKTCSIDNWTLNQERPISGRLCWGIEAYQSFTRYTIFSLLDDDSKFCFGKLDATLDGTKPTLRPTDVGTCYDKASQTDDPANPGSKLQPTARRLQVLGGEAQPQ